VIVAANPTTEARLDRHSAAIRRLARADEIRAADVAPKGSAQLVLGEATVCIPLGNLIDVAAEKARLDKAIGKAEAELERIDKKLSNEKFVANADPEVVAADRERKAELDMQVASLRTALLRVNEAG
jgi:valyl-tRNA synthetase